MNDKVKIVEDYLNFNDYSFIDKLMVKVDTIRDDYTFQEMQKTCIKIGVNVDEERLRKWVKMCESLENIPIDTRENIALRSKFERMQNIIERLIYKNEILKARLDKEED